MKDYRKLVSRKAPEGLVGFASEGEKLEMAGLVYEVTWVQDGSIEAMLESPGRKTKAVRCTCSECERSVVVEYAPPNNSNQGGKPHYGFYHPEDMERSETRHGGETLCPVCGAPVTVRCAAKVGNGEFASAETNVMSASLLAGEPGERPLVLTGWNIRRMVNRYGRERYDVRPLEAYVFEKEAAYKLSGWVKSYSGTAGYFMLDWLRQPAEEEKENRPG